MEEEVNPFTAGQLVECSTFTAGYRGAWFRCKILEFRDGKYGVRFLVKYSDFKDRNYRHKLYQFVPNVQPRKKVMMVRPKYPMVRFNRAWQVGDHCEFLEHNAFWNGTVVDVLGEDMAKVVCPEAPWGEGGTYNVSMENMRPGLRWSPKHGWSVKPNKKGASPLVDVVESSDESDSGSRNKLAKVAKFDHFRLPTEDSEDGGSRVTEQLEPGDNSLHKTDHDVMKGDGKSEALTDYLDVLVSCEDWLDRMQFMKDVLNNGFKSAMLARCGGEWEVSGLEGSKLKLTRNC